MPPSETDNVTVAAAPALLTAGDEKLPSTNLPMQPNCPTLNECPVKSPSNVKEEDLNGTNNGFMENKDVGAMPPAVAAVEPAAAAAAATTKEDNGSL
eukprot:scaffold6420_cov78-Skeletonema_dohrnii-CCMP3373.AAC.1